MAVRSGKFNPVWDARRGKRGRRDSEAAIIPTPTPSQFGMNLTSLSYFVQQRPYVNMASQEPWRVSTGGVGEVGYEGDVTKVDTHGNIIAMRSGATYTKTFGRGGPEASRKFRAVWTGAGTLYSVAADTAGASVTGGTLVSAGVYEFTCNYPSDPEADAWFTIAFSNTASANPVIGLDIREIDGGGSYLEPGAKYHAPWLALQSGRGVLRFMDWLNINGNNAGTNTSQWIPMDWADRTPTDCISPQKSNTCASLTVGSGTSALTFTAVDGVPYVTTASGVESNVMLGLVASGMKTATGAEGNNVTIQVATASGAGSVAVSYSSGKINILVTPTAGASNANAILAQMQADPRTMGYVQVASGGSGAVSAFGPTALSGGANAQNPAGNAVEDLVEICNLIGCDLHYQLQPRQSSDFVTGALTYIRDNLDSGLKLRLELSNEIWNEGSPYEAQCIWCSALGIYSNSAPAYPTTDWYDSQYGYAYWYDWVMTIAESVFSSARSSLVRSASSIFYHSGSYVADLTAYLKPVSSGGNANLYIGNHVDEFLTAPYWGGIFTNANSKGAWSDGIALAQYDYVYYASNSTMYFATAAHTSSFASPALDPQLLPLTAANLLPYFFASMDNELSVTYSRTINVLNMWTNDLGAYPVYGSYEGGPTMSFADPGGAGTAIMQAAITALYTDAAFQTFEGAYLSEYQRTFGTSAVFRMFASTNGPWGFNTNFGVEVADWSLDAVAPRHVAQVNAIAGKFPTYWWYDSGIGAISIPTISGSYNVGQVLTADIGLLRNSGSTTIQWTRDGTPISGALGATYTQVSADDGHVINITVTGVGALNTATADSQNSTATTPRTDIFILKAGDTSFTVPTGATSVVFDAFAPTGNGLVSSSNSQPRHSGSSGGFSRYALPTVTPGAVISCSIATGGGTADTWIVNNTTCMAHPGKNATTSAPGGAVSAGYGDLTYGGTAGSLGGAYEPGAGAPGQTGPYGLGGAGGAQSSNSAGGGGGADGGHDAPTPDNSGPNFSGGGNGRGGTGGGVGGGLGGLATASAPGTPGTGGGASGAPYVTSGTPGSPSIDAQNGAIEYLYQETSTSDWYGPIGGGGGHGYNQVTGDWGAGGNSAGSWTSGGFGVDGFIAVKVQY